MAVQLHWQEHRRLQRWPLLHHHLRISSPNEDMLSGFVSDISAKGFRLVSESAFPTKKDLPIALELPQENGKWNKVLFDAYSIWSERGGYPGFYETGFKITRIENLPDLNSSNKCITH